MEYTEVTVSTTTQGAEIVSDILMRLGAAGTQIIDRADLPDPSRPTASPSHSRRGKDSDLNRYLPTCMPERA